MGGQRSQRRPAQAPRRVTVAVLTGDTQDASALAITCQIDKAGELVLVVHCAQQDAARYPARLLAHAQKMDPPAVRRGG
jgi:hypothetical protein